jgi:hypothetical protein
MKMARPMQGVMKKFAFSAGFLVAVVVMEAALSPGIFIHPIEARVGRPLTPVSVAGVARRTTRRTIRRTTAYVAALPAGCTTVIVSGVSLHQCGGVYYQPYNNQYVIVNVD